MAGYKRYETYENDSIGTREIEAVIETVDAANWEEDFDLGEPWSGDSDPADDEDPE